MRATRLLTVAARAACAAAAAAAAAGLFSFGDLIFPITLDRFVPPTLPPPVLSNIVEDCMVVALYGTVRGERGGRKGGGGLP